MLATPPAVAFGVPVVVVVLVPLPQLLQQLEPLGPYPLLQRLLRLLRDGTGWEGRRVRAGVEQGPLRALTPMTMSPTAPFPTITHRGPLPREPLVALAA